MKTYCVTIQMKPLQQYFHVVLFIISILQSEIWDSSWILILGTPGSERVKRFLGVFMGFLEVKPEIFRTFLEKFRKDF